MGSEMCIRDSRGLYQENPWSEKTRKAAVGCYLSSEDSEVEIRENGDGVLAVGEGREKNLVMVQENLGIIRGYAKDAYLKLFKDENGGVFAIGFGGRMLPRK